MGKIYVLTQDGADMVGHNAGDQITPRKDEFKICGPDERCFSVDKEGTFNPDDINSYVALSPTDYEVQELIQ